MSQRPMQSPAQPPVGQEDITEPQLQAYIASLPEGPEKQRLMSVISRGQSMEPGATSAVEVTPDELQRIRTFNKAQESAAKKKAELNVEDEQDSENKLSTIASMPSDEELLKYLNDSTLGKGEEILKGPVASFFHVENEAQAADTVLGALQQNIKNIATKAKGDMNKTEVEEFNAAVGALNNKDIGPQARFKAYTVAKNMAIKKIALKHPAIAAKYGMGTATQAGGQPQAPTAKTEEEAHKLATTLPAGSEFIGPDGKTYKVRGR